MENNLDRLLSFYREDGRVAKIASALTEDTPARIRLTGMAGAQESFILAGTFLKSGQSHLFMLMIKRKLLTFKIT